MTLEQFVFRLSPEAVDSRRTVSELGSSLLSPVKMIAARQPAAFASDIAPAMSSAHLPDIRIDWNSVETGGLIAVGTGAGLGLGASGAVAIYESAGRLAAGLAAVPLSIGFAMLGGGRAGAGVLQASMAAMREPISPYVLRAGIKFGGYGVALGLLGYGAFKCWQYEQHKPKSVNDY